MEDPNFKSRLQQSGILKAASIYAVTAWLIVQVIDVLFPMFGLPIWSQKLIVFLIVIGFPIVLILVWVKYTRDKAATEKADLVEEGSDAQVPLPSRKKKWKIPIIVAAIGLLGVIFWQVNKKWGITAGLLSQEIRSEKVAVSVFNNFTGDENLDALGNMASDWITSSLRELDVKTTSPETMRRYKDKVGILPGNANGDISLQEVTEAQYVVTGSYYLKGDSLQISSLLESTTTGEVVYEFPVLWGAKNNKEELIQEISEMMKGYWAVKSSNRLSYINPPKYEAYQLFLNIWMFDKYNLEKVVRMDSTFILANIYLAYMYWVHEDSLNLEQRISYVNRNLDHCTEFEKNYLSYVSYGIKADAERRLQSINKNYLLDPGDIHMLHHTAFNLLEMNHLKEAKALYEKVLWNPEIPLANIGGNMRQAYIEILSRLGEYKKLIEFAQLGNKRIDITYYANARALFKTGHADSVISRLDEVNPGSLVRLAHMYNELFPDDPGNIYAPLILENMDHFADPKRSRNYLMWSHMDLYNQDSKAYACYLIRDYEKSEKLLLELREQQIDWISYSDGEIVSSLEKNIPWHMNVWMNGLLGTAYARQAKTEQAREQIQLLESYRSSKPRLNNRWHYGVISYWQARIYSILDEKELAVAYLKRSREEGRSMDANSFIFDWDLASLKGYGPYDELIKPK